MRSVKKVVISEKKIEAKVVDFCRKTGLWTRKFASPANRGVPDRIIIHQGRVLFLELKREGNTTTALQRKEIHQIRAHGGNAAVANSFTEAVEIICMTLEVPAMVKAAAPVAPLKKPSAKEINALI